MPENTSSEAQQTKSFGVIINRDRQKSSLEHGTSTNVWGNNNFKQIYLSFFFFFFFTKDGYCFRRYNCNRELIPGC